MIAPVTTQPDDPPAAAMASRPSSPAASSPPPPWLTPCGRVSLHLADALDFLRSFPDHSADLIVTSPPYNLGKLDPKRYGYRARRRLDSFLEKREAHWYADAKPEIVYQRWLREVVAECLRVAPLVCLNHKQRGNDHPTNSIQRLHPLHFLADFPLWREVIWDRRGSLEHNSRGFPVSHESVYCFGKPRYWDKRFAACLSVWQITPEQTGKNGNKNGEHACPWPVELPWRLIGGFCRPGGLVVDPFMGRATAAVACLWRPAVSQGGGMVEGLDRWEARRFAGCDNDERTWRGAVEWVSGEWRRRDVPLLGGSEAAVAVQGRIF